MTSLIACRHSSLPHASRALFATAAYVDSVLAGLIASHTVYITKHGLKV